MGSIEKKISSLHYLGSICCFIFNEGSTLFSGRKGGPELLSVGNGPTDVLRPDRSSQLFPGQKWGPQLFSDRKGDAAALRPEMPHSCFQTGNGSTAVLGAESGPTACSQTGKGVHEQMRKMSRTPALDTVRLPESECSYISIHVVTFIKNWTVRSPEPSDQFHAREQTSPGGP